MEKAGITSDEDWFKYYSILGAVMDYNSDMGGSLSEGFEEGEKKIFNIIAALLKAGNQNLKEI